jgi:hypothetical protein
MLRSARRHVSLRLDELMSNVRVDVSLHSSQMKLKREVSEARRSFTILNRRELDRGTSLATYKPASRYISENELSTQFLRRLIVLNFFQQS